MKLELTAYRGLCEKVVIPDDMADGFVIDGKEGRADLGPVRVGFACWTCRKLVNIRNQYDELTIPPEGYGQFMDLVCKKCGHRVCEVHATLGGDIAEADRSANARIDALEGRA